MKIILNKKFFSELNLSCFTDSFVLKRNVCILTKQSFSFQILCVMGKGEKWIAMPGQTCVDDTL